MIRFEPVFLAYASKFHGGKLLGKFYTKADAFKAIQCPTNMCHCAGGRITTGGGKPVNDAHLS